MDGPDAGRDEGRSPEHPSRLRMRGPFAARVEADPDPWQGWKRFGQVLLGGAGVVFVWEMVHLVMSLGRLEEGHDRGAVWAVLFMIFAVGVAVVGIGGGLWWSLRRQAEAEDERSAGQADG